MRHEPDQHHLLILSRDYKVYQQLLEDAQLPGLSISAIEEAKDAHIHDGEYDILFGEPSLVVKVLDKIPYVRWVQSSWAGVEPLLAPGLRRDYVLTNARNVYGGLISEYVFGYLLLIERQIIGRWNSQKQCVWDSRPLGTLKGKRIGLLGVGTIGAHLAKTAQHFGMEVLGYTRQSERCPEVDRYFHPGSLMEFTSTLDYLVCTVPGTPALKNIVNKSVLSSLPTHAWVINTGRGSTIDETALVDALYSGSIAGAVLDVFNEEPLPISHPLWQTPNTFITAHTAAMNNPPDIANVFIDNYRLLVKGEPLLFRVDFDLGY